MKRQVALIIETSSAYGRDLLGGIIRFMRMHDEWSVFLEERDLLHSPPTWLHGWKGDGIISRATPPELLASVRKSKLPLVEVADRSAQPNGPQVRSDDFAIGEEGARHLIERGFRRFGFCGYESEAWSERRLQGFRQTIREELDRECSFYASAWQSPEARPWEEESRALCKWLCRMEPPFAVMACNDNRGRQLVDACASLGLSVPEQTAIVGVDNDELLCRLCTPPLSSIRPDAEGVGFLAAETLSRMMNEEFAPNPVQLVRPRGVAVRQSSDVVATKDRRIAAALYYIRNHACRGLSVDEVVTACDVPRSTLERKLRNLLGRSPQAEIRAIQVKRIQELLITTELPLDRIATLSGFDHPEYMHVVFKRTCGVTPGQFRTQVASRPLNDIG